VVKMKERRCWANKLDDCDGGISKEHIISKSILSLKHPIVIYSDNEAPKELYHNSLRIKNLCVKHNNALSQYDKTIQILARKLVSGRGIDNLNLEDRAIYGRSLEKWFAKTTINLCHKMKPKPEIDINAIVDVIFEESRFMYPAGLYYGQYKLQDAPSAIHELVCYPMIFEDKLQAYAYILFGHRFVFFPPNVRNFIPGVKEEHPIHGNLRKMFFGDEGIYRPEKVMVSDARWLTIDWS